MSGFETDTHVSTDFLRPKASDRMETDTHVSRDVMEKEEEAESLPLQAVSSGMGGHSLCLSHP
jgi:hypothetical protein